MEGGWSLSHAPRFSVMLGSGNDGLGRSLGLGTGGGEGLACLGVVFVLLLKGKDLPIEGTYRSLQS